MSVIVSVKLGLQHQFNAISHLFRMQILKEKIPYRILPSLLILPVEREQFHYKAIYLRQSQHLTLRILDRHCDQRNQTAKNQTIKFTPNELHISDVLANFKNCSVRSGKFNTAAIAYVYLIELCHRDLFSRQYGKRSMMNS